MDEFASADEVGRGRRPIRVCEGGGFLKAVTDGGGGRKSHGETTGAAGNLKRNGLCSETNDDESLSFVKECEAVAAKSDRLCGAVVDRADLEGGLKS